MNLVHGQTAQNLVQSLMDETAESDPMSLGHFWPLNSRDR